MTNEKRLIDAEALLEKLRKHRKPGYGYATAIIGEMPTVDAVEVVRCKDCKYCYCSSSEYGAFHCTNTQGLYTSVYADDFCSYGERKEA